jgi:urease accessory protein
VRSSLDDLDESPPRPLVLGAIAAHAGIDAESLVRLTVYDDMACAVAALLKLEPGDPAHGVAMVLEACSSIEPHVAAVSSITSAHQIPAASAPQSEAWSEAHALTTRRLFRA